MNIIDGGGSGGDGGNNSGAGAAGGGGNASGGAGAAGGGGGGQAAAAAPGGAAAQASWRDSLPEALKGEACLQTFSDVTALANAHVHAQKLIGADKIPIPGPHASDEDWQKVYRKLGMPEALDKYEIKLPEGMDAKDALAATFKAQAFQAGVLPKQAQKLFDWYTSMATEQNTKAQEAYQAKLAEDVAGLKKEWGQGYENQLKIARTALEKFGGKDAVEYFRKSGLGNDVRLVKLLASIGGQTLSEDQLPRGEAGGMGLTPKQVQAKIDTIRGDTNHPYFNKAHPGHQNALKEMENLYRMLAG